MGAFSEKNTKKGDFLKQSKNAKIFCVVAAFSPKNKKLTLKYSQGIAIILAGAHCQHFCSETMPPIPVAHHINQINSSHARNGTADIIHHNSPA